MLNEDEDIGRFSVLLRLIYELDKWDLEKSLQNEQTKQENKLLKIVSRYVLFASSFYSS